jgi:sec-independent protein translocase protein TatA
MGFFGHGPELIVLLVVALLIFGPKKLPEMGRSIGKTVTEFRKGISEMSKEKEQEEALKTPSALNYEAIERENASQRVVSETPSSEVSSNEVKVD